MLAFRKQKTAPTSEDALTLRTADGTPLYTFPGSVVTSMRHMETMLLYNDTLPARISVVAALRQEGVTYTTLALATTLAYDLAARICVVDLNWWSPGLRTQPDPNADATSNAKRRNKVGRSKNRPVSATPDQPSAEVFEQTALSTADTTGLAAVLSKSVSLDDALVPTGLPNLALLPAGPIAPAQRPALARGDGLKNMIEQLGRRFDHVLLDIPAILATSDAIALASLGTACCLVIRQGVTPMDNVRHALDDIKHLPMLGVVLNQTQSHLPRWVRALVPQE
ncbi:MAG: chromosome partitioning protein [Roseiflexaceae bacterium]